MHMERYCRRRYRCQTFMLSFVVLCVILYTLRTRQFNALTYTIREVNLNATVPKSTEDTPPQVSPYSNRPTSNPRTLLFIAILSHWKRRKRRESIRETWLMECQDNTKAKCLFFTDYAGAGEEEKRLLDNEIEENQDTIAMPMTGKPI